MANKTKPLSLAGHPRTRSNNFGFKASKPQYYAAWSIAQSRQSTYQAVAWQVAPASPHVARVTRSRSGHSQPPEWRVGGSRNRFITDQKFVFEIVPRARWGAYASRKTQAPIQSTAAEFGKALHERIAC